MNDALTFDNKLGFDGYGPRYSIQSRVPAGMFFRWMASVTDYLILAGLLFFVEICVVYLSSYSGIFEVFLFHLLFQMIPALIISYIYFATFYINYGATPGKMIFDIKVVDFYSGEPLGLFQIFVREFLGKWLSACLLMFGYTLAFLRSDRRALHDLLATTHVIRD